MNRIISALCLCFLLSTLAIAAEPIKFSWEPNEAGTITGYKIHYGTQSKVYTESVDVGLPEVVDGRVNGEVSGLPQDKEYFFAATAYSETQESGFSNEVSTVTPLMPPMALKLDSAEITLKFIVPTK